MYKSLTIDFSFKITVYFPDIFLSNGDTTKRENYMNIQFYLFEKLSGTYKNSVVK